MRLSRSLTTLILGSSKITTVSRLWRYCGPSNCRFNFLLYWYATWVFFLGRQCAIVFPIYVRKYRKYTIDRWIVVYTVCASSVISPLRQWLDSYPKTSLKMWHTFKHFIHMQYFLLPTNLVIVFVLWVSTGVLYEPQQCSLFWDYILNFVFASICAARPVHTVKCRYNAVFGVQEIDRVIAVTAL